MVVRKVQLEFCFESKSFAPSDDILTVQRYELILKLPNFGAANAKKISFSLLSRDKIQQKAKFWSNFFCNHPPALMPQIDASQSGPSAFLIRTELITNRDGAN